MDHEKHVEMVAKYNEQVPIVTEFRKNLLIPEGHIECSSCGGFGKEVGISCLTPIVMPCRACKGEGHTDIDYAKRQAHGESLREIRRINEITLRTASIELGINVCDLNDIECGYIPDTDYEAMKNFYKEKFSNV